MNLILTPSYPAATGFSFKNVVTDLLQYAKKPTYIAQDQNMTVGQKLRYCAKIFLAKFCYMLVAIPIIIQTKKLTGAEHYDLPDTWGTWITVVAIAPVLEELLFRAALRFSRYTLGLAVSGLIGMIGFWVAPSTTFEVLTLIVALLSILLVPALLKPYENTLKNVWKQYFAYIFHTFALGFGLIHLSNFDNVNNYLLAVPLVTTQIVAGYFWGYARMRFGLWYSIGLHASWNLMCSIGLLSVLIAGLK